MCTKGESDIFRYEKTIESSYWYYREYFDLPRSNKISLTYHIRFGADKCCPIMGFDLSGTLGKTFHSNFCYDKFFYNMVLFNHYLISMDTCTLNDNEYVCKGTKWFVAPYPQYWLFLSGYECGKTQGLNITVNVTLEYFENFQSTCKLFSSRNCQGIIGYDQTAFPNALGEVSEREANDVLTIVTGLVAHMGQKKCYQHAQLFLCRIFIPECDNGTMMYPCFQMCQEALTGCEDVLQRVDPNLFCTGAMRSLDPTKCFYKPIHCPNVASPEFGKVNMTGHDLFATVEYSCDRGYELEGGALRTCTYSGTWNGTAPVCKHVVPVNSHISVTALVLSLLVVVAIIALCIYNRKAIRLFVTRYEALV